MIQRGTMIAVASTAAALLTAMASWSALDLPRPALTSDLKPIEDKVADLEVIILNNDWWRYEKELEDIESKLQDDPRNQHLRQLRQRLRRDQSEVQVQLEKIDRKK